MNNIIFYLSDQQRYDTLGCYGQPLNITPNLDELANEGVLFQYAFSPQPVCGPTRSILQSGKYATRTKCYRNGIALPVDETNLVDALKDAGYYTGYIGKWHLATNEGDSEEDIGAHFNYATSAIPPKYQGNYDFFLGADVLEFTSKGRGGGYIFDQLGNKIEWTNEYRSDFINNRVLNFVENHKDDDKPFFLFVSQIEPHHQNNENRYEGPEGSYDKFKDIYQLPKDLIGLTGDYKESYPDYLGCVENLDKNVGELIKTLKDNSLYDNTLLFYTSDHGSHFRTRNNEYKRSCHDASIRIPMIVHGPGFKGGIVCKQLVSLIDIPSTILRAANAHISSELDGDPIQKAIQSPDKWKDNVFVQISESAVSRAIRTKRYKYCITAKGYDAWDGACKVMKTDVYYDDKLYDLVTDPIERHNLVDNDEYKNIKEDLRILLKTRMKNAGEKVPIILDKE